MPSTRSHLEDFNFPSSTVWSPVYPSKYFSCKVLTNHLLLVYAITAIHVCPPRFVKYSWLHQQGFELHGTIHTQFFFSIVNPAVLHTVESWMQKPCYGGNLNMRANHKLYSNFRGSDPESWHCSQTNCIHVSLSTIMSLTPGIISYAELYA